MTTTKNLKDYIVRYAYPKAHEERGAVIPATSPAEAIAIFKKTADGRRSVRCFVPGRTNVATGVHTPEKPCE